MGKLLAIKGHATRGKEVIEILEMLGGENDTQEPYDGSYYNSRDDTYYFIDSGSIRMFLEQYLPIPKLMNTELISLEQFLEKYPYKVGDKVILKHKNKEAVIDKVTWCCDTITYRVKYDGYLEGNWRVENLRPSTDHLENKKEVITMDIPEGYEFVGVDDDNQKIVFERIKPLYPSTVKECCEILGKLNHARNGIAGYMSNELWALQKLLICRDAYWKLADDWKPDWEDDEWDDMYYISFDGKNIHKETGYPCYNATLIFPTEEMRDAFYDNFEKEIEECKELL